MGVVVNAVKIAAAKRARTRSRRPSKVLKIRNRLYFKDRVGKFRRFRAETGMDSATLVALAMDKLTPALLRASIIGVPVTVEVADERTAEVFRDALAQTCRGRPTDRLVEVVAKTS
jgi:hypothetical protein